MVPSPHTNVFRSPLFGQPEEKNFFFLFFSIVVASFRRLFFLIFSRCVGRSVGRRAPCEKKQPSGENLNVDDDVAAKLFSPLKNNDATTNRKKKRVILFGGRNRDRTKTLWMSFCFRLRLISFLPYVLWQWVIRWWPKEAALRQRKTVTRKAFQPICTYIWSTFFLSLARDYRNRRWRKQTL